MDTTELIKKVRKIEIKTRGLSRQIFAGEYHSAFKGRGMTFSEVREYQYGDDIRNIDWKVTARFDHPYVKVFEEERELTVMMVIDISGSQEFGTVSQYKKDTITEISALLSFSAIQNNDKIGAILFSDHIEKFIPPQKGRKHALRIIRELLEFEPEHKTTNISESLRYLTNGIKKRATAFVISDFIDFNSDDIQPRFSNALKIASNKHDLVALRVMDQREREIPPVGLVRVKDSETGELRWIDTSNKSVRNAINKWWSQADNRVDQLFKKFGIDNTLIRTDQDYVKPLMQLFERRSK